MAKKKLGNKYVCYQCGCKFYDLSRPKPICPKCGADQNEGPKKSAPASPKAGATSAAVPRPRARRRRDKEDSLEPISSLPQGEIAGTPSLEDGLSLLDDEGLIGTGAKAHSEKD